MEGYLGELEIEIAQSKYKDYTPVDWAMYFIESYGQIDGAHHKQWVLDQVARIFKGTRVIVKQASWDNGHTEDRISLAQPPLDYSEWVLEMKDGEDGPDTCNYDFGIAP